MNESTRTKVYEQRPEGFLPSIEIAATYVNTGGKLLLLELAPSKSEAGAWGVPAGKLEANETPIIGARRELFEETGIAIASENVLQSLGQLYIRKPNMDYVYHLFGLDLDQLPTVHLSGEHTAHKWVSRAEAENLPLMNGAKQALDLYYKVGYRCNAARGT